MRRTTIECDFDETAFMESTFFQKYTFSLQELWQQRFDIILYLRWLNCVAKITRGCCVVNNVS